MSSLLIIDDEPNVCYSLQRALESPTLKISTAGTAREGIECIRQQPAGRRDSRRAAARHVGAGSLRA